MFAAAVLRYIAAIKYYLDVADVEKVIFSTCYSGCTGGPSYYMGEHESQGRFLYRRAEAIQPALLEWMGAYGCNVEYLLKKQSFKCVRNFVRDLSALGAKFLQNLRNRRGEVFSPVNESADVVLVVRAASQLEFFAPLLARSELEVQVLIGRSCKDVALASMVGRFSSVWPKVRFSALPSLSLASVLSQYLRWLFSLFTANKSVFKCQLGDIDTAQACREISIMSVEIELYAKSLSLALAKFNSRGGVFITGEQKSPHAYADAVTAHLNGMTSFQFMTCDQDSNDLPYPVFGDVYVVDMLRRRELFSQSWSTCVDKVEYVGCVKNLVAGEVVHHDLLDTIPYKYCYYAHASEPDHNVVVVQVLKDCAVAMGFRFCIKLHPRDNGGWLRGVTGSEFDVYSHGEIDNAALLARYKVAVSSPSGVILDLICSVKPVLILDLLTSYRNANLIYMDDESGLNVDSYDDLRQKIVADGSLSREIESLNCKLLGSDELIPSLQRLYEINVARV